VAVPQLKHDHVPQEESKGPSRKVSLEIIRTHANELSEQLNIQRKKMFPPVAQKTLRKFTSGEAAKLIGVADAYLRQLALEGKGPQAEVLSNGRRMYSLQDIHDLRAYLDDNGKASRRYVKHRSAREHLQVISCVNFKGGSAKTTTAAHLAQYLALNGYRVLAVDLDPQASFTALHGFQPEFDVHDNESIYASIRYDEHARDPREIIRHTYVAGLDIIPANLEVMEFEHDTPTALAKRSPDDPMFFERIGIALNEIENDYDIVVIDCPPQLGYLTLSALSASTSILVTVHPQMLDVMSMSQFLKMASDLLDVVRRAGGSAEYDWFRYLVTRFEPGDSPQSQMVEFMRDMFGEFVCEHAMVKSTAISDAGITKQTIYEASRERFSKSTFDRAIEAMNNVNSEIEHLINEAWGRG
jgi:chromosome partitioning protein